MAGEPVLVVIFLRGGADGLNIVAPAGDPDYRAARGEDLRVTATGDGAGRPLANALADVDFRWHRAAGGLAEMYDAGELAVVHAAGLDSGSRSHFDAETRIERAAGSGAGAGGGAAPGSGASGWLGRWLAAAPPAGPMPVLALESLPDSLRGAPEVTVAGSLDELILGTEPELDALVTQRIGAAFGAHPLLAVPARRLLTLSGLLKARLIDPATGEPRALPGAASYPESELGVALNTLAQAIRLDLGLRVATLDHGGWDTHAGQADVFDGLVGALGGALAAFRADLGDAADRVTVVVQSEFGRRLRPNSARGTDHGHGNLMLAWGAGIRGGRMYGRWPGLSTEALDDGADLAVTTDYRQVLAEILAARPGGADLARVFPGLVPAPLGLTLG